MLGVSKPRDGPHREDERMVEGGNDAGFRTGNVEDGTARSILSASGGVCAAACRGADGEGGHARGWVVPVGRRGWTWGSHRWVRGNGQEAELQGVDGVAAAAGAVWRDGAGTPVPRGELCDWGAVDFAELFVAGDHDVGAPNVDGEERGGNVESSRCV